MSSRPQQPGLASLNLPWLIDIKDGDLKELKHLSNLLTSLDLQECEEFTDADGDLEELNHM